MLLLYKCNYEIWLYLSFCTRVDEAFRGEYEYDGKEESSFIGWFMY